MPGFTGIKSYATAYEQGRSHQGTYRKAPAQTTVANWWVDLSMAVGNPLPNYYASEPYTGAVLAQNKSVLNAAITTRKGWYHGEDKSPLIKHLAKIGLTTPTAALVGQYMLLDYLFYYPFIDPSSLDIQVMDNTLTLPRSTSGDNVQIMPVVLSPTAGISGQYTVNYTNSAGVSGRVTPVHTMPNAVAGINSIISSIPAFAGGAAGPFMTLQAGDKGVQSIQNVTFTVADGGLLAFVLVKPLCDLVVREVNTTTEVSFVDTKTPPPRIDDGAFLNLIVLCAGSISGGFLQGYADFVWSDV